MSDHSHLPHPERTPFSWRHWLFAEVRYLFGLYFLCMASFSALRLLLWWRNADFGSDAPPGVIANSFFIGLRFDLAVGAYLMILLFLPIIILPPRGRL